MKNVIPCDPTELRPGEPHPMASMAMRYVAGMGANLLKLDDALAASDRRTAVILRGTIQRLMEGRPVSDRYIMGLALMCIAVDSQTHPDELVDNVGRWLLGHDVSLPIPDKKESE